MHRLISTKAVIAKLYRDLRLTDSTYVTDMVEWFGEALGYIRAFPSLTRKVVELEVTDHQAELPLDFVRAQQIVKIPEEIVLRYNSSTFPASLHTFDSPNRTSRSETGYIINFGYIETDFEEGKIMLSYLAPPLDEDNFPMIPDESVLLEALKWFVVLRMIEGGWKHPAGLDYPAAEQRWFHYCSQARQKIKMPDIGEMQRFMESWVRLVPDYSRFDHLFADFQPKHNVVTAQNMVETLPKVENFNAETE